MQNILLTKEEDELWLVFIIFRVSALTQAWQKTVSSASL